MIAGIVLVCAVVLLWVWGKLSYDFGRYRGEAEGWLHGQARKGETAQDVSDVIWERGTKRGPK